MFRVLLCPLLDRLRECGFCVVYKMGVALMGGGQEFLGVLLGGWWSSSQRGNTIKSLKASHHQSLWKENYSSCMLN